MDFMNFNMFFHMSIVITKWAIIRTDLSVNIGLDVFNVKTDRLIHMLLFFLQPDETK